MCLSLELSFCYVLTSIKITNKHSDLYAEYGNGDNLKLRRTLVITCSETG